MSLLDKILERAAALRRLRDRAANRHEAEAAARALAVLLDRHQLDEAAVGEPTDKDAPVYDNTPLYTYKRLVPWRMLLAQVLAEHYGVVLFRRSPGRGEPDYAVVLAGRPDDIQIVRHMWAWLSVEATRLLAIEAKGKGAPYRTSWMAGFAGGIRHQLRAARREAWNGASATALAVLNDRERRATEAGQKGFAKLGGIGPGFEVTSTAKGNVDGFVDGHRKGRNVALGDTLPAAAPEAAERTPLRLPKGA